MKREEAIKALKWFKEYNEEDYCGGDRIQDELGDWYYRITEQDFETFDMAIQALEQEPRWIPVSERLPKKTGWYLITFKTYNGNDAVSEMCYRKPENYWTDKDISKKVFDNNEVIAWMPKPKAYKAESENP